MCSLFARTLLIPSSWNSEKSIVKLHMAVRQMDSRGCPRGESINWPALVETKTVLFWIKISFRYLSSTIFFRSSLECAIFISPQLLSLLPAFLFIHLHLYYQLVFCMVPGKISENILLVMIVTVFGPSISCFIDYWTDFTLAALSHVFTTAILVISGQGGVAGWVKHGSIGLPLQ